MGGYVSASLEEVLTARDLLHDVEGRCLVVICETEGNSETSRLIHLARVIFKYKSTSIQILVASFFSF